MHNSTFIPSSVNQKFGKIIYKRPKFEKFEKEFFSLQKGFDNATSFEEQNSYFEKIYLLRDQFDTMYNFAAIKSDANTADKYYQTEINYFNNILPQVEQLISNFYQSLINASFKKQIEEKWGKHIFSLAINKSKQFHPSIMAELTQENLLKTKYTRLIGSINFEFNNENHNLKSIDSYIESPDRTTRQKANHAKWNALNEVKDQLDNTFGDLVAVRHKMATKLGYKNFTELGYIKMDRINYDKSMVSSFRDQLLKYFGPIAEDLAERHKNRLGYNKLYNIDKSFHFNTGNPVPKFSPIEILNKGQKMYDELSPETSAFFNNMMENELLDVINRPNKSMSSYCTEISQYRQPFIFASFNSTSQDIKILTHEAGHAFQYYCGKNKEITEYRWPSYEAAEVHSMSMEYLTYPWMHSFFEEDAEKYFFSHISNCVLSMLSKCVGDHFQETIYDNPELSPDERASVWRELEKKYLPFKAYLDNPYLESGRLWQVYWHMYNFPFYFIDYALAQICAMQIWQRNIVDPKSAWNDYMNLCSAGGTLPFLEMIKSGNLQSPFEANCVANIAKNVSDYIGKIDDSKF